MSLIENGNKLRAEVWRSIEGLNDEQLNRKTDEGKWTIAQVLDHLYLIEKAMTKAIKGGLENAEETQADEKPVYLTADRSKKVKAPAYLEPSDGFMTLEGLREKLNSSRAELTDLVAHATEERLAERSLPHQVFGQLRLSQWVEFIGYHEKRHLAQIEELKMGLL